MHRAAQRCIILIKASTKLRRVLFSPSLAMSFSLLLASAAVDLLSVCVQVVLPVAVVA